MKKDFIHLHVHTQYSINNGLGHIRGLVQKAISDGMRGMAITDLGNMFAIKEFHDYVSRLNKQRIEDGEEPFKPIFGCEMCLAPNYHLVVLAKNYQGYKNLIKLVSRSWTDGYNEEPFTNRSDLERYHEGLIVLSGCLAGEVPTKLLSGDIVGARETIEWYQSVFGDDYYLELQRPEVMDASVVAHQEDYENQEKVNGLLIALSKEYGIKVVCTNDVHSDEQVQDIPDALSNTIDILDKVEFYSIDHEPVLPLFPIPEEFESEFDYLKELTLIGAQKIYGERLHTEVEERLRLELELIETMGFSRYFLIIQDLIHAMKNDYCVLVGPGRGSVAGSLVCFCLGITAIDPLKHGLLVERFYNKIRYRLPDIDIDFDDDGQQLAEKYLEGKYGKDNCVHIVAFEQLDKNMTKLEEASIGIHACGYIVSRGPVSDWVPVFTTEDPNEKGHRIICTQYPGESVEDTGLVKFDLLNLRVLTELKTALFNIERTRGVKIDLDRIPIDDPKTFALFQEGKTKGVFAFESKGMQRNLRNLHPTVFSDLVALYTLYRPGVMKYLPSFIASKTGHEEFEYDNPRIKSCLKETYGLTIYQEQIMQLSRQLAGFSCEESERLRKAMGKLKREEIDALKPLFIEGGKKNGHNPRILEKIWRDWEKKFGLYAFCKSHAVCYTWLAFQTAYLKAHYPVEYMSALRSCRK